MLLYSKNHHSKVIILNNHKKETLRIFYFHFPFCCHFSHVTVLLLPSTHSLLSRTLISIMHFLGCLTTLILYPTTLPLRHRITPPAHHNLSIHPSTHMSIHQVLTIKYLAPINSDFRCPLSKKLLFS